MNNLVPINRFFAFLLILYAWHTAMPIVGLYTPAAINAVVIIFLFIYLISTDARGTVKNLMSIIPLYLLAIIDILLSPVDTWAVSIYGLLQLMILPLCVIHISTYIRNQETLYLFWIILFGYFITAITTTYGCIAFPGAARFLAAMTSETNPEMYLFYRSMNIGSFSFVYSIVLILPMLIFIIRGKYKFHILGSIFLIVAILTVLETEYTTALLLTIGTLMLFLLPKYFESNVLKKYIWILVISFAVIWYFLPFIIDLIVPYIGSDDVVSRLNDLSANLQGRDVSGSGDIKMRQDIYQISFDLFLENPLLGSGEIGGGHSYILDTLAKYGLIGLGILIFMYRRVNALFIKPYKSQPFYGYLLGIFTLSLIMAFVNPKDNMTILAFIMPLFSSSYIVNQKIKA